MCESTTLPVLVEPETSQRAQNTKTQRMYIFSKINSSWTSLICNAWKLATIFLKDCERVRRLIRNFADSHAYKTQQTTLWQQRIAFIWQIIYAGISNFSRWAINTRNTDVVNTILYEKQGNIFESSEIYFLPMNWNWNWNELVLLHVAASNTSTKIKTDNDRHLSMRHERFGWPYLSKTWEKWRFGHSPLHVTVSFVFVAVCVCVWTDEYR